MSVTFETYTDRCRLYETWEVEEPEDWDELSPRAKGEWLMEHLEEAEFKSERATDEEDREFWRVLS